jgi:hypothetical protein
MIKYGKIKGFGMYLHGILHKVLGSIPRIKKQKEREREREREREKPVINAH